MEDHSPVQPGHKWQDPIRKVTKLFSQLWLPSPTRHHGCPQTSGEAQEPQKQDQETHPTPVNSQTNVKIKCN
jgi:hypothetical protein